MEKRVETKMKNRVKDIKKAALSVMLFILVVSAAGCNKNKGTEGQPSVTPQITDTVKNQETPDKLQTPFAVVSPVPQSEVEDIRGIISKEDYPVVDGSTATIPLSEAVFMYATGESRETASNVIKHTKTTNSYNRLYDKEADLLIVYEPAETIAERMKTEELLIKPIGLDALVFMGNTANPVETLTTEQLIGIYTGEIDNWSAVGGSDAKILAFQRPVNSGSQTLMQKLVMGDTVMADGDNVFRYNTMSDILEGMLEYTGDDNTLGYSVFYYANNMYSFPELKFIGVDGVIPSAQTIYDGSYPLVNAFYAVIRPDEPEDSYARKIFNWLTGEEGQKLVLDTGYVPVIMPEGGKLKESYKAAGDIELTPLAGLNENEHYIYYRKQSISDEFSYGNVVIYDDKWNKCASFYNVSVSSYGVYDGRYINITQIRSIPDGEDEYVQRVYDIRENRYLTEEYLQNVTVIDGARGYFAVTETDYDEAQDYYEMHGKVIDINGNILAEDIPYEDYLCMYRDADCYVVREEEYTESGYEALWRVYDEEFRLKSIIATGDEYMPKERKEGVSYYSIDNGGCVLDEDGDIIISGEKFIEKFGDGTDAICKMQEDDLFFVYDDSRLYEMEYNGDIYYTDRYLNFIVKEQEESGYFTKETSGEENIAYYYTPSGRYYFGGGTAVLMSDGTLPDEVCGYENNSCLLVRREGNILYAEEYEADRGLTGRYEYPLEWEEYFTAYYGNGCIIIYEETDEEEVRILPYTSYTYNKKDISVYSGNELLIKQRATGAYVDEAEDGTLLLTIDTGDTITLENESTDEEYNKSCIFLGIHVILKDGRVTFMTEEPGYAEEYGGGYIQLNIGNYSYVYDCCGNQIIKSLNLMLAGD